MNSPSTFNETASHAADSVLQALHRSVHDTEAALSKGSDRLHRSAAHLQSRAARAGDATVGYIEHEPLKAVLIAAAAGAALMWLLSVLGRRGPN